MAYSYTSINGQRVQSDVAAAFNRLNAAFRAAFGLNLLVSSGTRTTQEQHLIFVSRFRVQGSGNGPYNDVRWYQGKRWVRVSSAGTVAVPGTSNHEEGGPIGPRALDIRDSGGNAGVMTAGNARSNWIRNNARNYGFNPAGYGFGEPWHIEYTGGFGGGTGSGISAPGSDQNTVNRQTFLNQTRGEKLGVDGVQGPATTDAYKRYQTFLRGFGYTGDIDGQWGPGTQQAHERFAASLQGSGNITVDGQWGPSTTRKLQAVLGVTVDGEMGPNTIKALQGRLGVAQDGEIGPNTAKALQAAVGVPQDGEIGPQTVTGLQNYLNRGGDFKAASAPQPPAAEEKLQEDGEWGPATTKALQKNLGAAVDGEMGPITWKALQKATGQTEDGQVGPNTIKALQMNVGAGVDGQMGPNTVKALQVFLNAGKKFTPVRVVETPVVTFPKPATATYPDADWWDHSPNSSPRRDGDKIEYFVIHHAADTNSVETQRNRFMRANDRNVSPNWLIGKDGTVHEIVPPDKFRAWTTGSFDYKAVTVETQNTSGDPNWGISEESHVAIAKLVYWAHKRWGIKLDRQHVIGHREVPGVPATACPGPSMNLEKILAYALQFKKNEEQPEEPDVPDVPEEPEVPEEPNPETWELELPLSEAKELKRLLAEFIELLP